MSILIVNESESENLGDQLITKCSQELIKSSTGKKVDAVDLTRLETKKKVLTRKQKNNFKYIIKKKLIRFFPKSLLWFFSRIKLIAKFDISKYEYVLIGGGQILLGGNSFPIANLIWTLKARKNNKKVLFFNVGCAKKIDKYDRILLGIAINNSREVWLRDKESLNNFSINFPKKTDRILTIDPVFFVNEVVAGKSKKDSYILVFPASYEEVYLRYNDKLTREEYIDSWVEIIEEKFHIGKVIVSSSDNSQDISICKDLVGRFSKTNKVVFKEICNKEDLCMNISSAECVVSARMHPLIIALSYKIDNIQPYEISDKIRGFKKEYLSNYGVVDDRKKYLIKMIKKTMLEVL